MYKLLICFFCFWATTGSGHFLEGAEVVYAHVIFRHGDRSPAKIKLPDVDIEHEWPMGLGHLTNRGKRDMYVFGQWLKERYKNLTGDHYNASKILANSTHLDRTISSAECVLAGMFPPQGQEVWNPEILWQPIPVHSVPQEETNILFIGGKQCPQYNAECKIIEELPEANALVEKYESFMNYIASRVKIKLSENKEKMFMQLLTLYYELSITKSHGKKIPEWAIKALPRLEEVAVNALTLPLYTTKAKRLAGGPMIANIIELMKKKRSGDPLSLVMYSVSEVMVAVAMYTLGIFNMRIPPFGCTLMFELLKTKEDYYVQVHFRNSTSAGVQELSLKNCPSPCSLDEFVKSVEYVVPEDWEKECRLENDSKKTSNGALLGAVFIVTLFFILSFTCFVIICRRKRMKYERC